MTKSKSTGSSRVETAFVYTGAIIIALSLIALIITLVGSSLGQTANLLLFSQISLLGMPIGFMFFLAQLILAFSRKRRENKS